jgi:hypothetical protein
MGCDTERVVKQYTKEKYALRWDQTTDTNKQITNSSIMSVGLFTPRSMTE